MILADLARHARFGAAELLAMDDTLVAFWISAFSELKTATKAEDGP